MALPQTRKPSTLLSLFPPPVYLTMPSVGVDISDRTMKFVELEKRGESWTPVRFGDRPLEEGIIQGGKILDGDRLRNALTSLKKECGCAFVRASLPEQQAYVFQLEVPVVPDEEQLIQTIEFKLEENVPLSPADAILGYDVLGLKRKTEHMAVTVTAYPRKNVVQYVDILEAAGFMPLSLEIESQAIARAVIPERDQGTYLIVDFGETRTGIAVVSRGLLAFTSTVEVKGRDLTTAIKKCRQVDGREIARIKNEEGIWMQKGDQELAKTLRDVVSDLTDELERHYMYWNTHAEDSGREPIKEVLLCGGNANLAGLPEYLTSRLRVPVKRANVWKNAFSFEEEVPSISFEDSLSYATAVGLALHRNK